MTDPTVPTGPATCPTCRKPVVADDMHLRRYLPFCSKRCQLIDLGKWFDEEYVISSPLADASQAPPDQESTADPREEPRA